jgi:hypothetical protein
VVGVLLELDSRLTQVSHGRPETRIKPKGSFQRHYNLFTLEFRFSGWEGGFPVDAEHLVDAFLFVVGLAGLADVNRAPAGERESGGDEAVGAEQAADRLPVARVVVSLQAFTDTALQVVGEDADEPMSWRALRRTAFKQPEGCRSREARASTCGLRRGPPTNGNSAAVRACL